MTEIGETTTVQWDSALEAIERCYELGWTDGLPVVPPTEARVAEFIERSGKSAGQVIGELPERRREITVGKVAANAVMAGCLPEYMPVVITATAAMLDPVFNLVGPSSSMGGSAILTIVNGPVIRELNINARNNLFGPGNRANATIGRAIRLILMNACAAIPGVFDRSVIGHPGKYTYCIAEAETETHWTPLHVERGFQSGSEHCDSVRERITQAGALCGTSRADSAGDFRYGVQPRDQYVHLWLGRRDRDWREAGPDSGDHLGKRGSLAGLDKRPGPRFHLPAFPPLRCRTETGPGPHGRSRAGR